MSVLGTSNRIYSHSYLGLGLMAAREAIFSHDQPPGESLESACMVTSGATQWSFHGKEYTIRPTNRGGFENCMKSVEKMIDSKNVDQCEEVPTRKIAGKKCNVGRRMLFKTVVFFQRSRISTTGRWTRV